MEAFVESIKQTKEKLIKGQGTDNAIVNFSVFENEKINHLPSFLRVGKFQHPSIDVPALIPFAESKGLVSFYKNSEQNIHHSYIQNIILEVVNSMTPMGVDIILYDPVFMGMPFSLVSQLGLDNVSVDLITDEFHLKDRLGKYLQYSKELAGKWLIHHDGFVDYWQHSNDKDKRYCLIVINDTNFTDSKTTTDLLVRIAANAKNNNAFIILSGNSAEKEVLSFFDGGYIVENGQYSYLNREIDLEYNKVQAKNAELFSKIQQYKTEKKEVAEEFDIRDGVKIHLGTVVGSQKKHFFRFGNNTENYHAIVGGQSGKGKSVLLNTLIRRGRQSYSSNHLKFMLFDCKGVEFNDFEIDDYVIERESTSDVHVIMDKLKLIENEFQRRRELFKEHNVKSIEQLVSKGFDLYRLVCIVDEFQFLFSVSDYKMSQQAEDILVAKILRTGRSFGIHLIVATQSLGDGIKGSILNNIPLRIALGMTEWQSASFLSTNNTIAKNLERGLAVYNGNNGQIDGNELVKVDMVN